VGCSDGERSSFDFSGTAPQKFVAVNGLSIQVLAGNFSALNCSVAEGVMNTGTVDDSADILARCVSITLAGVLRASMSGWIQR